VRNNISLRNEKCVFMFTMQGSSELNAKIYCVNNSFHLDMQCFACLLNSSSHWGKLMLKTRRAERKNVLWKRGKTGIGVLLGSYEEEVEC
jgi:hypothetical protein